MKSVLMPLKNYKTKENPKGLNELSEPLCQGYAYAIENRDRWINLPSIPFDEFCGYDNGRTRIEAGGAVYLIHSDIISVTEDTRIYIGLNYEQDSATKTPNTIEP